MTEAIISQYDGFTVVTIHKKIDGKCMIMNYAEIQHAKTLLYKDVDCIMLYPKQNKNVDNDHEYHLIDIQGFVCPFDLQNFELHECKSYEIKSIP